MASPQVLARAVRLAMLMGGMTAKDVRSVVREAILDTEDEQRAERAQRKAEREAASQ